MQFFFQPELIEKKLGAVFHDKSLLKLAFTHRSYWNENKIAVMGHNERLEFLGDSILNTVIADYLYRTHPDLDEGVLSKLRSQLVDAPACAQYIHLLGVENDLLLGKGEQSNQGKGRESIMADLFEGIIGALYLDQGLEAVRTFFFAHFQEDVDELVANPQRNWKAELQDWAQKTFQQTPLYETLEESGPAHDKIFRVAVWVAGDKIGMGEGSSKKEAQIEAAQNALLKLEGYEN